MKRMVTTKDIYINIVVNYDLFDLDTDDENIAASESDNEITPNISKYDVDIKFYEFVQNILGVLNVRHFHIIKHEGSDIENHNSYYISFYPTDKDENDFTEYMFHIRISDHFVKGINRRSSDYYQNLSDTNKEDTTSDSQAYRFVNIVIDQHSLFKTTGQALKFIEYLCDQLRIGQNDVDLIEQQYRTQKHE